MLPNSIGVQKTKVLWVWFIYVVLIRKSLLNENVLSKTRASLQSPNTYIVTVGFVFNLGSYELPAVVFISTAAIDNRSYLYQPLRFA